MTRKYYLAYGSNLNINQMLERCPDAVKIGTSVIEDYCLTFRGNSTSGVANVEPKEGGRVPVGVWAVSASDEAALDRYEGWPWLYGKETLQVDLGGQTIDAMIYIMRPGRPIAKPSGYYLNVIADGYDDFGFDKGPLLKAAEASKKGEVA